MPLTNCVRCTKLYNKLRSPVCPACESAEDADYETIRQSLQACPNQTAEEVAENTGVGLDCVLRLIDDGRIVNVGLSESVSCGRCGAPAISITKRLCEKCLVELNMKLAQEQSRIVLPPKRSVDVKNTGKSVWQSVDDKRR